MVSTFISPALFSNRNQGFPGGSDSKESACNVGDPGSIPGLGRFPGEGNWFQAEKTRLLEAQMLGRSGCVLVVVVASLVAQTIKESACNVGDPGSIPGSGRFPGEGNGNPLQYSCLGSPLDRKAWQATWGHKRVGHDLATKQQ